MLSHQTDDSGFDDLFISRFEEGSLESFTHEDHVRVAYAYARRGGRDTAIAGARRIRALAQAAGRPEKFHETMTVAWARVIAHLVERSRPTSFAEFLASHPQVLDRRLLSAHYSHGLLFSDRARAAFVEPDLLALP
jgi:hypothetical protein